MLKAAKPVVFHPQMLSDFNTIDELGHKMLAELAVHDGNPFCRWSCHK